MEFDRAAEDAMADERADETSDKMTDKTTDKTAAELFKKHMDAMKLEHADANEP